MFQPGGSCSVPGSTSVPSGETLSLANPSGPPQGAVTSPTSSANEAVQQVGQKAAELKDQTIETVHTLASQAREQAGTLISRLRDQGGDMLVQQKDRTAGGIAQFASALRQAANCLRSEGNHAIAGYADDVSGQVERASQYLQSRDVRGLMDDLGNLSRRRPELFLAGMFVAGLTAARFLKASRRRREIEEQQRYHNPDLAGLDTSLEPAGQPAGISDMSDEFAAGIGAAPGAMSQTPGISPQTDESGFQPGAGTAEKAPEPENRFSSSPCYGGV